MTQDFIAQKDQASAWFRTLRDEIVASFEDLEVSHTKGPLAHERPGRFEVTETERAADGDTDADGVVEGTFSFSGYNAEDMSIKEITEGKFKAILD